MGESDAAIKSIAVYIIRGSGHIYVAINVDDRISTHSSLAASDISIILHNVAKWNFLSARMCVVQCDCHGRFICSVLIIYIRDI